jgi:uncharacterized RDD family membrane protein YckC
MAICASCGTNNVDGTKFCVQCGAALAPSPGAWRTPTEELNAPAGGSAPQPTSSPYTPPPSPNPTFQTPPPPPVPYGYATPAPTAYGTPMNYAQWGDRVVAALIDGGINVGIMIVLFIIFGVLAGLGSAVGGSDNNPLPGGIFCVGMLITFISIFGFGIYNKIYLVSKRGSSIGQNVQKLKVVDAAGNIPQTGTLVLRLLVQTGLGMVPMVGWILVLVDLLFPLWDEKKQTIHDKAASTFVIKTA